jgi:hypothetical protein
MLALQMALQTKTVALQIHVLALQIRAWHCKWHCKFSVAVTALVYWAKSVCRLNPSGLIAQGQCRIHPTRESLDLL